MQSGLSPQAGRGKRREPPHLSTNSSARLFLLLLPGRHGEKAGMRGCFREYVRRRRARKPPLTRIASSDAIRPLPAGGARQEERASSPFDEFPGSLVSAPSPRPSRGEGRDEGLFPRIRQATACAEAPPHPDCIFRCNPASPRRRGEARGESLLTFRRIPRLACFCSFSPSFTGRRPG